MPEAIITTRTVRPTSDGRAVAVIAKLDAGELEPGMYIHIPLNSMLSFTVRITDVMQAKNGGVRLLLDCGDDPKSVPLVVAFNFEDETLEVLSTGNEWVAGKPIDAVPPRQTGSSLAGTDVKMNDSTYRPWVTTLIDVRTFITKG